MCKEKTERKKEFYFCLRWKKLSVRKNNFKFNDGLFSIQGFLKDILTALKEL
jgi:hypothetical protein